MSPLVASIFKAEGVIALAAVVQIGVNDPTNAHDFGNRLPGGIIEFSTRWLAIITGIHNLPSPHNRFIEQAFEANGIPRSRFEWPLVFTQDGAKLDMCQFDIVVAKFASCRKEHVKMLALTAIDHVENGIGLQRIHTILDGGEIGCGIREGAVAFANNERSFVSFNEHALRTLTGGQQFGFFESLEHAGEHRIVPALTECHVKLQIKPGVESFEGL